MGIVTQTESIRAAIIYRNRGNAYIAPEEFQRAIADYDRAIALAPDDAAAYASNALGQLTHYEEALASYNRAIALAPNDAAIYSSKGDALVQMGQYKKPTCLFLVVLINPDEHLYILLAYLTPKSLTNTRLLDTLLLLLIFGLETRFVLMATLEALKPGVHVKGLLPGKLVTLIEVKPYGATVVEVTYKDASGLPGTMLLYQQDAARLEIASNELPWSFDADGALFRLVSEAYRPICTSQAISRNSGFSSRRVPWQSAPAAGSRWKTCS